MVPTYNNIIVYLFSDSVKQRLIFLRWNRNIAFCTWAGFTISPALFVGFLYSRHLPTDRFARGLQWNLILQQQTPMSVRDIPVSERKLKPFCHWAATEKSKTSNTVFQTPMLLPCTGHCIVKNIQISLLTPTNPDTEVRPGSLHKKTLFSLI